MRWWWQAERAAALGAEGAEARAERKRRQRLAQEEFRLKQLQRLNEKQDIENTTTNVDNLLLAIPTQEILKNEAGNTEEEPGKRKSPALEGGAPKRRGNVLSRIDNV
ncbi:uncharacterized protein [Epargyreus clarus]|uniref:uncharacterized protein n=1 Tax=Epargyreus clarus TaxID=520877 RepID=UPI003C2F2971